MCIRDRRQAVLTAVALRCLGGELQAQLWPVSRREIEQAKATGIADIERIFSTSDLVPGEIIFAATGVSGGDLLRGVRFLADSARTHTLLMCTRCNWVPVRRRHPLLRARAACRSTAARLEWSRRV